MRYVFKPLAIMPTGVRLARWCMAMRLRSIVLMGAVAMGLFGTVVPAKAQPEKMHRIGFLSNFSDLHPGFMRWQEAFRQGLRSHGWLPGKKMAKRLTPSGGGSFRVCRGPAETSRVSPRVTQS